MDSVHHVELQWIHELHRFRTPLLDSWFEFCNFFDTAYFIIFLIVGIGIFYNRKLGWRLLIIFTINSLVNKFLKHTFDLPRPHDLDPQLGIINLSSPGFPSGAAQSAVLLCGILIKEGKSWWRYVVGPLFAVRNRAEINFTFMVTQRFICKAQICSQLISFQGFATQKMKMPCCQKGKSYFCPVP